MDTRTAIFVAEYKRQREFLIEAYPELADDADMLADTLEGETAAPDLISQFIRDAREDEAMASAVGAMMKDMAERKSRLSSRSDKRRSAALAIMQALGMRKIEQPDFTASVRHVPPKVEIIDEEALSPHLWKVVRSPDKTAIKEALALGPVNGAQLSNGSESLTIRNK